jgi:hypothetical protein
MAVDINYISSKAFNLSLGYKSKACDLGLLIDQIVRCP